MASMLNAVFSLVINGYTLLDGPPSTSVRSKAACAGQCLADASCYSFFHSKVTRTCLLHSSKYVKNEELTASADMRFFIIDKGFCPTEKGYALSTDPHVCYRFELNKVTHDVAVADCVKDGGFLVRIDSPQKNDFMVQIHQEKASSSQPWIDGTDKADEGVWRFSDGTLMPYSHWEASQPNHDGDCVRLRLRSKKVKWWDTDCSLKHGYICEIPVA